jgi:hypothetical protein
MIKVKHTKDKLTKNIKINHSGSFTKYCKSKGYAGVTCACIREGLNSKNTKTRKKANFAKNFGHKCK